MPPATPSTTRGAAAGRMSALDRLRGQQAAVDLAQRDRERLLLRRGLHQRADVLQQALAELAVVGVDLAGTLGGEDHQRVLGLGLVQQLVDGWVGDALRVGDSSRHELTPKRTQWVACKASNPSRSSAACSTKWLTIVTSNSGSAASSSCAWSRRARIVSGSSVPRPISRRSSSSQLGGARNTSWAEGIARR